MNRLAGECPDLESIAAYLDNRLDAGARARVAEHLASCSDCYSVYGEAAHVLATPGPWRPTVRDRVQAVADHLVVGIRRAAAAIVAAPAQSALAGAVATAAILLVVVGGDRLIPGGRPSAELQALVAAVGTERTIEGRLTGGFAYGPLRGAVRSGEAASVAVPPDVRIAAAQIEKRSSSDRSPRALDSLGLAYLVTGELDRAIGALEEAADRPQPDAQVLSDLSAAYLARASRNHPQDFARAATMAERAVKANPRLAEAWFNRACALERLSLADEARQAWQDYLKIDDRSEWAAEARSRLKALSTSTLSQRFTDDRRRIEVSASGSTDLALTALVEKSPEAARVWAEDQLLNGWPRLVLSGRDEEARALASRVERVANAAAESRGDTSLRDATAAVIASSSSPSSARALATAHQLYRATSDAYEADRIADTEALARQTLEAFGRVRSPFGDAALRFRAIGAYYANDFPRALTDIEAVAARAEGRRYTRLRGLARRLSGLIHLVQGDYGRALDDYLVSLECFREAGELEEEAAIQSALAENFEFVGDTQQSWQAQYAALSLLGAVRDPIAGYRILQTASLMAVREEMPEAALHLQRAALENAQRAGRTPAVITGYLNRAAINERLGRSASVVADLDDARRLLTAVQDPLLASRNESRILLARGEALTRSQPTEAIGALNQALAYLERARTSWSLASVYLARGRAHLAAHDPTRAERDFAAGIEVFERMRSRLASDALRVSYFEQPWDLFTEMIRLQADRHDAARALAFAEQARARTLLEEVDARPGAVSTAPDDVRRVIPPGVAILYYASLDDRLLTWVVTARMQEFVSTGTRQQDVARLVERWRVEPGHEAKTATLMELYDALVRPVERMLPAGSAIVIVPDGVLHAVPFAALIRRDNRRYLIEEHALETVPSLTLFARSIRERGTSAATWESALVVGNPRTDDAAVGLPDAEREARDIAALYPTKQLLVDREASKPRVVELLGGYDVLHFAGHGISNDDYPSLSRLLLAGDGEAARSLFANEIAMLRVNRLQLVVLAACRTSAGRIRRGEGVLSLARPFIAAGVPTVVASLWDVDDRASHALFVAFHRGLRRGLPPAEALRSAQLDALAESDALLRDPSNWANFVVIGGAPALGVGPADRTS